MVRPVMTVNQVPDVNFGGLTLTRRMGTGDDVLGIAVLQANSGDILRADLDLGRAAIGPLSVTGNLRQLDIGAACVRGGRDHRMVTSEHIVAQFDTEEPGREGLAGSSLVSIGSGRACIEASEIRLANGSTLVVRYSGTDSGGHPAMLHEHGRSLAAVCTYK